MREGRGRPVNRYRHLKGVGLVHLIGRGGVRECRGGGEGGPVNRYQHLKGVGFVHLRDRRSERV